jgi:hypothetical protein
LLEDFVEAQVIESSWPRCDSFVVVHCYPLSLSSFLFL